MKKAKILLSAIAVVGIVGGAFALKTGSAVTIYTCDTNAQVCSVVKVSGVFLDPIEGTNSVAKATTDNSVSCTPSNTNCGSTLKYTISEE